MNTKILTIRPNRLLNEGMSQEEIYDLSRGIWRINPENYDKIKYAFVLFRGVIKGIFEIEKWHPGNSTPYKYHREIEYDSDKRWEFTGRPAEDIFQKLFLNKTIKFV